MNGIVIEVNRCFKEKEMFCKKICSWCIAEHPSDYKIRLFIKWENSIELYYFSHILNGFHRLGFQMKKFVKGPPWSMTIFLYLVHWPYLDKIWSSYKSPKSMNWIPMLSTRMPFWAFKCWLDVRPLLGVCATLEWSDYIVSKLHRPPLPNQALAYF